MPTLCRDCFIFGSLLPTRPACRSPRLLSHPELITQCGAGADGHRIVEPSISPEALVALKWRCHPKPTSRNSVLKRLLISFVANDRFPPSSPVPSAASHVNSRVTPQVG